MVGMKPETKHCAIYCRKSSDEGLDMDFNTLDAQREACEAYITSQRAEGWQAIKTQYSDGGYSGGNMERPALQHLLADIKDGKVHTIVVYKIDRLTRSLMDFAKLVDIFDEYGVTFVSVTQSFNTTTSMGRLTLNVLLSFAQFEREVSAERIRDKFAASKKKGMWMGGNPPLGYEVQDRKLIINLEHAAITEKIFDRYLTLGCVAKLKRYLDANGIKSPQRISGRGNPLGGNYYSRGALYNILSNPIYIGKIKHKDNIYDGLHDGIIEEDIWHKVQKKLSDQAAKPRGHTKASSDNILKGLLFDYNDTPYSPVFTKKGKQTYRYYVSQNTIQDKDHPEGILNRLPAHEIEKHVSRSIEIKVMSEGFLSDIFNIDNDNSKTLSYIVKNTDVIDTNDILKTCVNKIVISVDQINITLSISKLKSYFETLFKMNIPTNVFQETMTIETSFKTQKSYKGAVVIKSDNIDDPLDLPPQQLKNLVRGVAWRDEHFNGLSMKAIAEREGVSKASVGQIIMRSFDTLMAM
jgi:site-specific DNA recombinase